ncbi:hypothetical protein BDF20DRAFT_860940 [Mycotypha africana]|uniref:uncharacterized protein n=1 Tax=Mycotypha africana TaxID=64632 RepID=UPI0022FFE43A|nr:uncharacterized protein BDF20DRAFT_860940 [Mycotypha africana]KAI8984625.1 hypothetical protein BDF20DRAFT_860940 [Mycotypha africana]
MWHGKSVISGPSDKVVLTRWDRTKPPSYFNLVCLTRIEANEHEKLPDGTNLEEHYGKDVFDRVQRQFDREQQIQDIWGSIL